MLPQYVQDLFSEMTQKGRKLSTISRYNRDLTIFFNWLNDYKSNTDIKTCKSLTYDDIAVYFKQLSNRHYSDDTIRRLASVLNRLFVYLNINSPLIPKRSNVSVKRDLGDTDFITDKDWSILLKSALTLSDTPNSARNFLIERNTSILILMRIYGLTVSEVHRIDMNDVNFAQQTIQVRSERVTRSVTIANKDIKIMLKYFNTIPKLLRPRYRTTDPLFVAFYNQTSSYRFNYQLGTPQRFSIRGIQKMIKDEVDRAGLCKISSIHLRNTSILNNLKLGTPDEDVIKLYGLSDTFSLQRYKKYIESI